MWMIQGSDARLLHGLYVFPNDLAPYLAVPSAEFIVWLCDGPPPKVLHSLRFLVRFGFTMQLSNQVCVGWPIGLGQ